MFDFDDLPDIISATAVSDAECCLQVVAPSGEEDQQGVPVLTEADTLEKQPEICVHRESETDDTVVQVSALTTEWLSHAPNAEVSSVNDVECIQKDIGSQPTVEPTPDVHVAASSELTLEFEKPPGLPEPRERNKQPPPPPPPLLAENPPPPPPPLLPEDGRASATSEPADVPAASMGMGKSNSDTVTPDMLQQLSEFMNKRAKTASDAVFDTFRERLHQIIAANDGKFIGKAEDQDQVVFANAALKGVVKDTNCIIEQFATSEKATAATLKQVSDPEQMKQNRRLKSSVEKAVSHWRDSVLNKTVLKTVEGTPFADQFAEGLLAANSSERSSLFAALQPSKEQLQEGLQEELRRWCGELVSKHVKGGLMRKEDLINSKSAFDFAMQEVSRQAVEMFTKFLQDTGATSKAPELVEVCVRHVREDFEKTLRSYLDSQLPPPPPLPAATSPLAIGHSSIREKLSRRCRAMVAPLHKDLDFVEREVAAVRATLDHCRAKANLASSGLHVGGSSSSSLHTVRKSTFDDCASGRILTALQTALRWDSEGDHMSHDVSLVEASLTYLQTLHASQSEPLQPEEVLARPEVSSQLDGNIKSLLIVALMERVAPERSPSASRIETNLEWILGLLQCEPGMATLESMCSFMTATLDGLSPKGTHLEQLQADSGEKKRIAKAAKFTRKQLQLLLPAYQL